MKTIVRPRDKGKTSELIRISGDSGAYIICASEREAYGIMRHAASLNIKIPFPITYREFDNRQYSQNIIGFLFDNIDYYIQCKTSIQILAVTLTENNDMSMPKSTPNLSLEINTNPNPNLRW